MGSKYPYRIFYAGTLWNADELKGYPIIDAMDSIGNSVKLIRGRVIVTALHPSLAANGAKITDDGRIVLKGSNYDKRPRLFHRRHRH